MISSNYVKSIFVLALCAFGTNALAEHFNIPAGDLKSGLDIYTAQTGVSLMYVSGALRGVKTRGVMGDLSPDQSLTQLLNGTGFVMRRDTTGAIGIVREKAALEESVAPNRIIAAAPAPATSGALETVTVTSSKIGGDVQNIPISITALSQEQLTATQTAGGPDLVKQVPNMTFSKTNFTGYNIQLRGIGTQAISVTTDPAVAVAFNDMPFIRNHFFEQEFYDVSQVEVLRGPQGTLYGRNATAGVVNLISAKPSDQFEAMASLEIGNYGERRPEGMINIPIIDDRLDIRIAGEWTKRQGYSFNSVTDDRIDGRDLWSGRVTIGWKPISSIQTYLIWEHFSEDDDRMRTAKQLCKYAPVPAAIDGVPVPDVGSGNVETGASPFLSQSCLPVSLYSPEAFEVPNGFTLPYITGPAIQSVLNGSVDPYADVTQSRNLRVIESALNPQYRAKNDTVEFNADWNVTPALTVTSQTGFNHDFLWSTEDYNRFTTAPGIFASPTFGNVTVPDPAAGTNGIPANAGLFCDPQLGCSDRVVAQDLSDEHAWQLNQEFRLASNFSGPLNFSVGGNYLHYETEENYYVFINTLTAFTAVEGAVNSHPSEPTPTWNPGLSDNHQCLGPNWHTYPDPTRNGNALGCDYIDPNPISSLNNEGHNYFLSENPYLLDSYAGFGEVYYNVISDLKLTAGLRWTDDRKHFTDIPSELLNGGWGYPSIGVVNQQWSELTGRAVANWTPKLDFTDQTLIYGSYSHGYKAGGANPPGAVLLTNSFLGACGATCAAATRGDTLNPIHPLTFKPEFIDAFELGTKNTLLDGALTFNADVFYYNYENYQISRIVDRTSINDNFDAHVKGAEIESTYEPIAGLRFNFAGGWEDTALAKGSKSVDLMDRTAGNPDWVVVKPFVTQASNCILPAYVLAADFQSRAGQQAVLEDFCALAYQIHVDPVTGSPFQAYPTDYQPGFPFPLAGFYPGFDPVSPTATNPDPYNGTNAGPVPNNGEGFDKNIGGNKLPNAPPFTVSFGAQYTMPLTTDWAGTLRSDYYWQDYSWARVFNDNPYDRIRGYTNVNLTLIFTNQNGWQVMLYDKNIFNETAITGDFLNSDDSGLTTNVFLTDPKLIGIRVTKNW
jgi:iron complex outermembrane receptor protein